MTTQKERPILFSGEMVRAILEGRKTQTRRIAKAKHTLNVDISESGKVTFKNCPYGQIGDRLWVRESVLISTPNFGDCPEDHNCTDTNGNGRVVQYVASNPDTEAAKGYGIKTTPSIFMPRWASRIMLEIEDIGLRRLQSLSAVDARAEGIEKDILGTSYEMIKDFAALWDSINSKKAPWDSNPWVWVIQFKRVQP